MDCGLIGSNGEAAALHVVSDTGLEHVSVNISNRDMADMIVIDRVQLMLNMKYVVDQNVSVRNRSMIMCRNNCFSIYTVFYLEHK